MVDKTALQIAVEYVEELVSEGALDHMVPVVVNEFDEALKQAKDILVNENVTIETVEEAFIRLSNAIQMLEFKKGNKENLIVLVEKIAN